MKCRGTVSEYVKMANKVLKQQNISNELKICHIVFVLLSKENVSEVFSLVRVCMSPTSIILQATKKPNMMTLPM